MKDRNYARMHTAEHILNRTMQNMFGCPRCFSAHINPKKSKCDYRFERELKDQEAREIESRVNKVIAADLEVSFSFASPAEAKEEFDLSRLPGDRDGENVRVVYIGDYDACPCIGEHVKHTAEIGEFRLTTYSFADKVLRLRFKLSK